MWHFTLRRPDAGVWKWAWEGVQLVRSCETWKEVFLGGMDRYNGRCAWKRLITHGEPRSG